MALTENVFIPACVFIDPYSHLHTEYFPVSMVFDNPDGYIEKYKLNGRYGDFAEFDAASLPKEITDIKGIVVKENGCIDFISIRAMHRIIFNDISNDNFHFLVNHGLRKELLEYDKSHGNFFSYLIAKTMYPKHIFTIRVHLANSNDVAIGAVDHIETVMTVDTHAPGFLVYCHDLSDNKNYTFYIDETNSTSVELMYGNTVNPPATGGEEKGKE